jgi:sortase A
MTDKVPHRAIRNVQRILLVIGLTLVSAWTLGPSFRTVASRAAIAQLQADELVIKRDTASTWQQPVSNSSIDFRLWSTKRIQAYEDGLKNWTTFPVAILRIPHIKLVTPVFDDTDDLTLNIGVGRILGTARFGQSGNVGIAGHRDGFFRGLKDLAPGDIVELTRSGRTLKYRVARTQVVSPEDTYVLNPTPTPTLTLVTCFPFYFVGSAPKRYVVTALLEPSHQLEETYTF